MEVAKQRLCTADLHALCNARHKLQLLALAHGFKLRSGADKGEEHRNEGEEDSYEAEEDKFQLLALALMASNCGPEWMRVTKTEMRVSKTEMRVRKTARRARKTVMRVRKTEMGASKTAIKG